MSQHVSGGGIKMATAVLYSRKAALRRSLWTLRGFIIAKMSMYGEIKYRRLLNEYNKCFTRVHQHRMVDSYR